MVWDFDIGPVAGTRVGNSPFTHGASHFGEFRKFTPQAGPSFGHRWQIRPNETVA